MGPIYGSYDEDWDIPRQPSTSSETTKETQMVAPAHSNEQLDAIKALGDRLVGMQRDHKAGVDNILQVLKANMEVESKKTDILSTLAEQISMLHGKQNAMEQMMQQMFHTMNMLALNASVARPGVYNHPVHGLQYPGQHQHPANWSGHGMQVNDGYKHYMEAHHQGQMQQPHAFSGQHTVVHRRHQLSIRDLKMTLANIPTQQNWITSLDRRQLLTTLSLKEDYGDPTGLVSDLGLSSCVAPYFAYMGQTQREKHNANYRQVADTMNRLQNGRSMDVVGTEMHNLKKNVFQWVKDFHKDIANCGQISPLLFRSPHGEMIAFIPVPSSQLLLVDAVQHMHGYGKPEMALEMSYLVAHLGHKEPPVGDTEGLIRKITDMWAHVPGVRRGCYLMEVTKLSDALGSSELSPDLIREIDCYGYEASQHADATFQDFTHVSLRRAVMIHVPDMVKQF